MQLNTERVSEIISKNVGKTGGVISALRAIQLEFGHIPEEVDALVANIYNISRAEVLGIISFYADFTRTPKARTTIRVCVAEACQAAGSRELENDLDTLFNRGVSESPNNDEVDIERVYCLGLCSVAPSAMVGERLVGLASTERIISVAERFEKSQS